MDPQSHASAFPNWLRYPDVLPEVLRRENAAERVERLRKTTRIALSQVRPPRHTREWMRFSAGRAAD